MQSAKAIQVVVASSKIEDWENLRSLLVGTPWELISAANRHEAVKALHRTALPIVLCDQNLDGEPWLRTFRALARTRRRTCVILLCNAGDPEICEDVIQSGAFDLLARPFQRDHLLATLLCAYSQCRMNWFPFTRVRLSPMASAVS